MAPPNGSAKARKATSGKQAPKPVVPALPLPYVKRKAAADAAARAAPTSGAKPSKPTEPKSSEPQLTTPAKHETNGVARPEARESTETSPSPAWTYGTESSVTKESTAGASTEVSTPSEPKPNGQLEATTKQSHTSIGAVPAAGSSGGETLTNPNGTKVKQDSKRNLDEQEVTKGAKARPPPTISPTRYQMPPPFQPASRTYNAVPNMGNSEMHRGPRPPMANVPTAMHQAHQTSGSIHFGTFHDSQSSSPAPPHSGGMIPSPGMPGPEGRPAPYMGPAGAGFPPMMHYGADMMQHSGYDGYGRPTMPMAYGPGETFPPYAGNFGPSTTPHSFRDSQSSAPQDDGNMYGQFSPPGRASHGDDMHAQVHQGRMLASLDYSRAGQAPPPHMVSRSEDNGDGILSFLQQQFGAAELADATLELRYRDDRAPPVRIPGHRLLFARSESLAAKLREQHQLVGSDQGPGSQTLLLETDSKWLRSDSFYMAVQRLYGLPLLPMPAGNYLEGGDLTNAGSASDQCDFALSYAAAGDVLCWSPVLRRGCEVATQLLGWQTMEKVLEFALQGFADTGSRETFAFGEGSAILLNATVTFIVHNLPESFQLDTTVDAQTSYARLPECPPAPPAVRDLAASAPIVARGSSVQLGKGRRSQQITGIQFGDLSLSEEGGGLESETPKATRQAQPVPHAVLNRILLNLPFAQLKALLDASGSGNVSSWANAEARYRIVKSAVEEREARRLRTLDAILRGRIPNTDYVRLALRSPTPQDIGPWTAVGWQEEILPYGNPDGPSLGRKWVPFAEAHKGPAAEYP